MKKKLIASAILTTACLGAIVFAQDAKTEEAKTNVEKSPPVFSAPLGTFNVTPSELNNERFNINAAMAPVVPLLESLAKQGGVTLILSDVLKAHNPRVFLQLRQVTAREAIESIADKHGLAWGKVGADTYLIVETKPQIAPILNQQQLKEQMQKKLPVPSKPVPDWLPFDFNGQRYYRVPLQNGSQKSR